MAGPIRISILANASQAKRELNSIAGETSSLGSKMGKFGKIAGAAAAAGLAVAGAAAIKFGADSVKAASDAQQSLGATRTVFGKFAGDVIKRSNEAATAVGLSANEYRELANVTGASLNAAGLPMKKVAGLTGDLTKRAADLSATFGGTTKESIEAIGSLMRGEADPIEKYGVSIKATDVAARLAAKGQDNLTGSALKAAEMQARVDLLMQQTAKTQGAFGRESGTLAHQQQVLGAQWDNIKAKVGAALLPVLTNLLTMVNANLIPAFNSLVAFLAPAVTWFQNLGNGASTSSGFMGTLATFIQTRVVPAVQGIITAFQGYLAVVIPIVRQVAAAIMQTWTKIQPQVQSIWSSIKNIIVSALSIIRSVIQRVTQVISAIWSKFGGTILRFITTTMKNVANLIKNVFKVIEGIFKVFSSALKGDWTGVWNGIKMILSGALGVVKALISQAWNVIRTLTSAAWTALKAVISKAWDGIKSAVSAGISGAVSLVRSLPGKITGALGNLGSLLVNAGRAIIQGLIDGITDMIGSLQSKLSSVTNLIPDWKGPYEKDKRLLRPAGRAIIAGLIKGFDDGLPGVEKMLGNLTDKIEKRLKDLYEGKALKKGLRSWKAFMRRADDALLRNAKAQDKNTEKIKEAREALADLIKERKDYAANLAKSILSGGNITSLGKSDEDSSVSISALLDQLKDRVENARRFAALIRDLTAKGLNQTSLQQLIDAGVEGGLATAEALASGGVAAVNEINALTADLAATGVSLGNSVASTMYDSGVQAAQGLVAGLEAEAKRLDKAARRLALALVRAVRKALKIKSPSRVFRGIGDDVTKGLVIGLDEYRVKKAGEALAKSLEGGFGTPALDAYGTAVSSSSQSKVAVTLTAEQVSALQRGREIQMDLDTYRAAGGRVRA